MTIFPIEKKSSLIFSMFMHVICLSWIYLDAILFSYNNQHIDIIEKDMENIEKKALEDPENPDDPDNPENPEGPDEVLSVTQEYHTVGIQAQTQATM